MGNRQTSVSKSVNYDTANCLHCEDVVFIDNDIDNVDGLPEGITVIVGGGKHISVDKTAIVSRSKGHIRPSILLKWFSKEDGNSDISKEYICEPCAKSIYGFE